VQARRDDGTLLPRDAEGELCLSPRSEGELAGRWAPYLGVWRDGEVIDPPSVPVATGDYGVIDSEGWLTVLDRIKVLIVRGGANVYPAEVERVLLTQDGVAGAAVFGVPDERMGERVAALVETNGDVVLDTLAAACREQLADYKVPERWAIVDALPRNAMGKVVRTSLVDLLDASEGTS
jgi:O-succinylbenzoic acid--CoA ligase